MKRQLKKSEKNLIFLLLIIVVLYGCYRLFGFATQNLKNKRTLLSDLSKEEKKAHQIVLGREQTQKEYDKAYDAILLGLDFWFDDLEQAQLFALLDEFKQKSGIEILHINFQEPHFGTLYEKTNGPVNTQKDILMELAAQYQKEDGSFAPKPSEEGKSPGAENVPIRYIQCDLSFLATETQLIEFVELVQSSIKTIHVKTLSVSAQTTAEEEKDKFQVNTTLYFYYLHYPFDTH